MSIFLVRLYFALPSRKQKFKYMLPGAALVMVSWITFSSKNCPIANDNKGMDLPRKRQGFAKKKCMDLPGL